MLKRGCIPVPSILFLAGAGWVDHHDAHARVVAVAQRLPSDLLGAGRPACKCERIQWFWGPLGFARHPAPKLFYE